jgi:hypothetical protein
LVSGLVASVLLLGCNSILGVRDLAVSGPDAMPGVEPCAPTATRGCYTGAPATENVGPCHDGVQTCLAQGTWGPCDGEVVPVAERCGNGIDDNCSGAADEDFDLDHDGFTTCGGDCCDSVECPHPELVNPGAFDVPGNGIDDDCDQMVDDTPTCDQGLASSSLEAKDFARAIDLCNFPGSGDPRWGVLTAAWTLADGTGVADRASHAIRDRFGTNLPPRAGAALGVISTGIAADEDDLDPAYANNISTDRMRTSPPPADWLAANNHALPHPPECPAPVSQEALDPVMLTLTIRVPTNARSFAFDTDFYSWEFPEYVCSEFNDYLVVLLDSALAGTAAVPADKNLATYRDAQQRRWALGVNLARLDGGLFTQCVNGAVGCAPGSIASTITTCTSTDQLAGTGFETADPGQCTPDATTGGATGWLTTRGNVLPGETITLRIALWDTSDHLIDSTAILDHFRWSPDSVTAGTDIH